MTVEAAAIAAADDQLSPIQSGQSYPNIINVLTNDTLDDAPIDLSSVTLVILQPAVDPDVVLDPATGNVSVGADVAPGTYTITYQICENLNPTNCASASVTIVVENGLSALTGTVYRDDNSNDQLDQSEDRPANWIVELVHDGQVIASMPSDAEGNYAFSRLTPGEDYEVHLRNPDNNVMFGSIAGLTLTAGSTMADQNLPIDPSGVVYDSVTRALIQGAQLDLVDSTGTPLPSACLVDASQRSQVTGPNGAYRFDLVPGGATQCPLGETEYVIRVTPPSGYSFISTVLLPQSNALDPTGQGTQGVNSVYAVSTTEGAPQDASPVYYLSFLLEQGDPDVVRNHIPLDPFLTRTPLVVTKTSTRRSASTGELVPYEITVRNNESVQRAGVDVVDILPPGMKYVAGSSRVAGVPNEPDTANGNRELVWRGQVIPANGSVSYNLVLTVGAGVTQGERVNTGVAEQGLTGLEISNRGTAVVTIVPSSVFDCSELIGKVFQDIDGDGYQDEGEPGVPSVRLVTVNGQQITTDEYGRYHIACAAVPDARIGSNYVLKLDPRTLPLGWQTISENPRSIRLTRGKMGELNFAVGPISSAVPSSTRKEGEE